jgi:AcrR family transcriptional regulator
MDPFPDSLDGTERDILEATYRALVAEGLAGTSMRRIADEFDGSLSLLYYHHDDQAGLFADFLDYLLDALAERLAVTADTPATTLGRRLDRLVPPDAGSDAVEFNRVLLELRVGSRDPEVRERFDRNDELVREALADPIERGIESGRFRRVDVDTVAVGLQSAALGATVRAVTLNDPTVLRRMRTAADDVVTATLVHDDR